MMICEFHKLAILIITTTRYVFVSFGFIVITGICMISLQMILVGHFIKFLVIEKSITPIVAGKVF
ncbi:hypothetical protein IC3_02574 [Bacillus cereus VD142]|nr:hypothetical protein IC3_02574 [Bacillus cereus VD142]